MDLVSQRKSGYIKLPQFVSLNSLITIEVPPNILIFLIYSHFILLRF